VINIEQKYGEDLPRARAGGGLNGRKIMKEYKKCDHGYNAAACLICENDQLRAELAKCYDRMARMKGLYKQSQIDKVAQKKLNLELRKEE